MMADEKLHGKPGAKDRPVYAVVRVDAFHGPDVPLEHRITVKKIVCSLECAKAEVERLNELNAGKQCTYFWQYTRLDAEAVGPCSGTRPGAEPSVEVEA